MSRFFAAFGALLLAGFALWPCPGAAAQAETSAIQVLVDRASEDFREGRHGEALEGYQRAWEAGGPPALLFMIGRCHQMMEQWQEAREAFRAFLAAEDVSAAQRARGEAELRVVDARLARGTLVVQVAPFGAEVAVDGRLVGKAPVEPLELPAGPHVLGVGAEGFVPAIRRVEVRGGERTQVAIGLGTARAERPPRAAAYSPWSWIVLGTGLACVAGGTVSYVLGELDHREVAGAEGYSSGGAVQMSRARAQSLADSGDTKKQVGYVLWGVGGAALVSATVLLALDATGAGEETGGVSVGASPAAGGGRLWVRGSF